MSLISQNKKTATDLAMTLWSHATFLERAGQIELAQEARAAAYAAESLIKELAQYVEEDDKAFFHACAGELLPVLRPNTTFIQTAPQYVFILSFEKVPV